MAATVKQAKQKHIASVTATIPSESLPRIM